MLVTFRQPGSKFLRSNTFANAIASKEALKEVVCECTALKDLWMIGTIWAVMLSAHFLSASHYQTTRHQLTQTGLMEQSAIMHATELVNYGPLALQVRVPHQP